MPQLLPVLGCLTTSRCQLPKDDLPTIPFESATVWRAWLELNHTDSQGLWIQIAKKAAGIPTVTHAEALEVALCFGWIDGQRLGMDETWFLQRFTPRRARSRWSQINVEKVEQLMARGLMEPSGLKEVDRAKADGRWDAAYASQSRIEVPDDFRRALEADPPAAETFSGLNPTNRYAILYRLHHTKTPPERLRRIETFIAMLSRGETIYPNELQPTPETQTTSPAQLGSRRGLT